MCSHDMPFHDGHPRDPEDLEGIFHTMSSAKRARAGEKNLTASEAKEVIDSLNLGIVCLDRDARVFCLNPPVPGLLNRPDEGLQGKVFWDLLPDGLGERFAAAFRSALKGNAPVRFEAHCHAPSARWLDCRFLPTSRGVTLTLEDITERKKAEAIIRESEEKYRLVVENANEGIIVVQDGVLCFVNPKISEFMGHAREDLIGKPAAPLIHPDDRELVMGRHARRAKGESIPAVYPFRMVDRQGNIRWMEINAVRIDWEDRPATLNFLTDISERVQAEQDRKKFEEQLGQSQKIEALGSFAGGIAHGLNNFIYPVIINTELLLEDPDLGSREQEVLQQTLSAACRQRDLVRQILFFSRRSGPKPSPVRVVPLLEEMIGFLRSSIPSTIEIRKSIHAPWDTVMGDAAQIQQVIMNLCRNASDAMDAQQGVIDIRLENARLKTLEGHPELKPGRFLLLSVRDDGCGMGGEVMMGHIFEPFFTTKEVGKGSGMGLPAVHGIVKSHGGAVTVHSEKGEGALFSVYLPVHGNRNRKKALP